MKARILLRQLELPYERVTVDLFKGETRTPEHFARNPDGRMPGAGARLGRDDRRVRTRSSCTSPRARPTSRPSGSRARACTQWMFFEQNRIEAELAYARFLRLSGRDEQMPEVYANRLERGNDALGGARPRALGRPRLRRRRRLLRSPTSPCTPTCTARTTPAPTCSEHEHIGGWLEPRRGAARLRERPGAAAGARVGAAGLASSRAPNGRGPCRRSPPGCPPRAPTRSRAPSRRRASWTLRRPGPSRPRSPTLRFHRRRRSRSNRRSRRSP